MSDLGDLLELLHLATTRLTSVRATISEWEAPALWVESARRFHELLPQGLPGHLSRTVATWKPNELPNAREGVYKVWRRNPGDLWLIEASNYMGDISVVRREQQWWVRDERGTLTTNVRRGQTALILDTFGERFIQMMFDPCGLLAIASLEVGDKLAFAGRHALAATARWRTGVDYAAIDWPYADATELLVDAQYGVLLRMEFLLDGRPFLRWTVDDVAFNEPMDDSLLLAKAPQLAGIEHQPSRVWRHEASGHRAGIDRLRGWHMANARDGGTSYFGSARVGGGRRSMTSSWW
jgi:hypothetical protein